MICGDERAQPVQVGVIVLFGFLIIALSVFQATIVPQENGEVEFRHSQEVQNQMADVRGALIRAAVTGEAYPVSVPLGTGYPPRAITLNPPPSSGNLRTVAPGGGTELRIENAAAVEAEPRDFWDAGARTYETGGLVYRPNYNVYGQAPAVGFENSVLYNRAPDGTVVAQSGQRLVDGRELDLTVLQGNYQRSGSGTASVDVSSPTADPRTVVVEASSESEPIRFTVPTALSEQTWETLLEDELGAGGYVTSLSKLDGELTVELRPTDDDGEPIRYELLVAPAGLGSAIPSSPAAYLTDVSGNGTSIPKRGSQQIVAEVRDEFNAPERGIATCAEVTSGGGSIEESPPTDVSDADGRIDYTYHAPDNNSPNTSSPGSPSHSETVVVTVSYDCNDQDRPSSDAVPTATATFEIGVYRANGR